MTEFAPIAFVAFVACGAALLTTFLLWHPVSADIKRRVDVLVGSLAVRPRASRGDIAAPRGRLDVLKRLFMLGMPRKWGVTSRPLTFVLAGLVAGGAVWLLSHSALGLSLWLTLPLVAAGAWIGPNILAKMEQGRADKRFVDLFPDAIDMIVRMLRAGLPVSAAIRAVAKESPAPIDGVFGTLSDQIDIGMSFEDALGIGSERIGLPDFRFFSAAVALQHTTGGNLVATLEILVEIIRRRRIVRMKAKAATAEVRMTAYVLGAMPFFVFGSLVLINPSYLTPLLTDPRGNVMIVLGVGLLLAAFFTMRRMMRSVVSQ